MGDRKPKKNSSGNSNAHKTKVAKDIAERPIVRSASDNKSKDKQK